MATTSIGERADLVGVVEAIYRLDIDEADWLRGLAEAVRPTLDHGLGLTSWVCRMAGTDVEMRTFVADGNPRFGRLVWFLNRLRLPEGNALADRRSGFITVSQLLAARDPEAWQIFARYAATVGVADVVELWTEDPSGMVVAICGPSPTPLPTTTTPDDERCWNRIARQLGTSPHTVANQVVAILRKLGLGSRYELAAALGRPTPAPGSESKTQP